MWIGEVLTICPLLKSSNFNFMVYDFSDFLLLQYVILTFGQKCINCNIGGFASTMVMDTKFAQQHVLKIHQYKSKSTLSL